MAILLPASYSQELFGLADEPATAAQPDQGFSLALLTLQPQAPVRDVFEFLTEIQESRNGSEFPLQLRSVPRRTITYTVPENAWIKQLGFNTQYGAISQKWAIPLWFEAEYRGIVTAGQNFVIADNDDGSPSRDYRDQSLALLWESPTNWQVLEIDSVGSGVINIYGVTQAFKRAWVMPLRVGKVVGSISRKANGHDVVTDITHEIIDNVGINVTEGVSYDELNGFDIYYPGSGYLEPPLLDGDRLNYEISAQVDTQDYELGIVTTKAPWYWNRVTRAYNVLCEDMAQVKNFREFLFRRMGRFRKFWEPSFDHDLRLLSTGEILSSIIVDRADGQLDWYQRFAIAIEVQLPEETYWQGALVDSIFPISDTEVQIDFTSSFNVDASFVRRVSWLGLKRLDSDRIEMNWIGAGVMKASVPVIELQSEL